MPESQLGSPEERACYREEVEVGEVIVGDVQCGGIIEQLDDERLLRLLRVFLFLVLNRGSSGTRAVGKKASAQGRNGLDGENLASAAG